MNICQFPSSQRVLGVRGGGGEGVPVPQASSSMRDTERWSLIVVIVSIYAVPSVYQLLAECYVCISSSKPCEGSLGYVHIMVLFFR